MQQGRGGMGSRKHGRSGHATQSPRFRLWARLTAERAPKPTRSSGKFVGSLRELFSRERAAGRRLWRTRTGLRLFRWRFMGCWCVGTRMPLVSGRGCTWLPDRLDGNSRCLVARRSRFRLLELRCRGGRHQL